MNEDDKPNGNGIIVPEARPRPVQREITVRWKGDRPDLDHLTGTEAKELACTLLLQGRQLVAQAEHAKRQSAQLANVIIGMVHRDAMRGLLGPDGQPSMPMRSTIPTESTATFKRVWNFRCVPQDDGSMLVFVEPTKDPNEPTKVVLP
jgi:hypothetical protein